MRARGSVSIVMAAALGMGAILAAFVADVTLVSAARGRAQVVADAAALAAVQELVVPTQDPEEVARAYAEEAGARLVSCRCEPGDDEAVVHVEMDVRLPWLGESRTVLGRARAVVTAPEGARGLEPWFVARLGCLFARVQGLSIVSGFRTRAEQARLYREKPRLAAPPGRSMHERGLAADLGFGSAAARTAAHRQASSCGLRFPVSYEPWHIEPAGIP